MWKSIIFIMLSRKISDTNEDPLVKKNSIENIKSNIKEKEIQLSKLKCHVDKSTVCSDLYNKVVLEKAILNKELQDIESDGIFIKIKNLMPRKRTLICDYFKR